MKTIFFDLDGTILDTLDDLKNAVNAALIKENFPIRTREEIRLFIGNGTAKLIERSCPKDTPQDIQDRVWNNFFLHYKEHYFDYTVPYKGIKEALQELKKSYRLVVVSNKDDVFAKNIVEKNFPGIFDCIQGTYRDKPRKPDPYIINKVIDELNIDRKKSIYVGDTNVDVESATNAGLPLILVTYGYRKKHELIPNFPNETYVDSTKELLEKLKEVLG